MTSLDRTTCRFDRETGARGPTVSGLFDYATTFGQRLNYSITEGTATAYDSESVDVIWSVETPGSRIFFAGGRLMTLDRYTLTSVG